MNKVYGEHNLHESGDLTIYKNPGNLDESGEGEGEYHNHPLAFAHGLLIQPLQAPLKCLSGFSGSI